MERSAGEHATWTSADAAGAFRWAEDPRTRELFIDGLVLYGPVDAARLKGLRLRAPLAGAGLSLPAGQVPSETDVHAMSEGTPTLRIVPRGNDEAGRVQVCAPDGTQIFVWTPRAASDLSTDEWYARTALLFDHIKEIQPRNTTQAMADACGVPFTTAVRWVRECRQRGLLPLSQRQINRQQKEANTK